MKDLITLNKNQITTNSSGEPTVTSLVVAELFGRRHADVLRSIRQAIDIAGDLLNQELCSVEYIDPTGRKLPAYEMTETGFQAVATGLTGVEATKLRVAVALDLKCASQQEQQRGNTNMRFNEYGYDIPYSYSDALVYGDYSGLLDDEIEDIEEFVKIQTRGLPNYWTVSDDATFFSHYPDIGKLGATCVTMTLFIQE